MESNDSQWINWLVVDLPFEKYVSQTGLLFPIWWDKYNMFQTTNQINHHRVLTIYANFRGILRHGWTHPKFIWLVSCICPHLPKWLVSYPTPSCLRYGWILFCIMVGSTIPFVSFTFQRIWGFPNGLCSIPKLGLNLYIIYYTIYYIIYYI